MPEKQQYQLEFVVKASPKLLYNFLATPSGLSEWFADDVNFRGQLYTFFWEGSSEEAELISKKVNQHIRFKWVGSEEDESFFEFRLDIDDLTEDVSLIITDFAEENEIEEAKLLWESQIHSLLGALGA
ncbi:MAG: START-like domain-containing protein [Vicingaceae bacterium]